MDSLLFNIESLRSEFSRAARSRWKNVKRRLVLFRVRSELAQVRKAWRSFKARRTDANQQRVAEWAVRYCNTIHSIHERLWYDEVDQTILTEPTELFLDVIGEYRAVNHIIIEIGVQVLSRCLRPLLVRSMGMEPPTIPFYERVRERLLQVAYIVVNERNPRCYSYAVRALCYSFRAPNMTDPLFAKFDAMNIDLPSFVSDRIEDPTLRSSLCETILLGRNVFENRVGLIPVHQLRPMVHTIGYLLHQEGDQSTFEQKLLGFFRAIFHYGRTQGPEAEQTIVELGLIDIICSRSIRWNHMLKISWDFVMYRTTLVPMALERGILDIYCYMFDEQQLNKIANGDLGLKWEVIYGFIRLFSQLVSNDYLPAIDAMSANKNCLPLLFKCLQSLSETDAVVYRRVLFEVIDVFLPIVWNTDFRRMTEPSHPFLQGTILIFLRYLEIDESGAELCAMVRKIMRERSPAANLREMREMPLTEFQTMLTDPSSKAIERILKSDSDCAIGIVWLACAVGFQEPRDDKGNLTDTYREAYLRHGTFHPDMLSVMQGMRVMTWILGVATRPSLNLKERNGRIWLPRELWRKVHFMLSPDLES